MNIFFCVNTNVDRIYTKKYVHACQQSDHIIAISEQTKRDIIDWYKIDPAKISVCYQSVNSEYRPGATGQRKFAIRDKYNLPEKFFLSVGTINERKNLLNVCKAMYLLRNDTTIPLVVIGKGKGTYYTAVKDFVLQYGLEEKIIFLSESPYAKTEGWLSTPDLSVIYQLATAMIYPSFFEGFGIPVLEAIACGTPTITSNVSCLPEAGGDAALYVNPGSAHEMAEALLRLANDEQLAADMRARGLIHVRKFSREQYVESVMNVYQNL